MQFDFLKDVLMAVALLELKAPNYCREPSVLNL